MYATEESPLGTAGSVRNAREQLTERFLVISGDVLTRHRSHVGHRLPREERGAGDHRVVCGGEPSGVRDVITREDGTIERFLEKPGWGQVFSDTINTGIYVLEPEIFDHIPEGRSVDFSGEVFPSVLQANLPLYGYVADGYWEDVGTTAAYLQAHEDILDGKVQVDVAGFELRPGVWIGKDSTIDPSVRIDAPAFVGENCTIDPDVVLGSYSTVGANTQVAERAEVQRSVIGENSSSAPPPGSKGRCSAGPAICGSEPRRARCGRGRGLPGRCPRRGPQRRKGLPGQGGGGRRARSTPPSSGSRGARTLFGAEGVQGIANVDISPELAVRLAKAWASGFEKGYFITASRDTSRVARVLKRALMVGSNSVGVNVNDLELATVPVTQHHVRMRGNHAPGPRCGSAPTTPGPWSSGSSTNAASTSPRATNATSSACTTRGVPPCHQAKSATSTFPPARSSSTRLTSSRRSV